MLNTTEIFTAKITVNNPVGTFTKRRMKHKGLEFNGKVKKRYIHVNGSEYFMQKSVCLSLHSKRNMCIAIAHVLNWVCLHGQNIVNQITGFQNCINFSAYSTLENIRTRYKYSLIINALKRKKSRHKANLK